MTLWKPGTLPARTITGSVTSQTALSVSQILCSHCWLNIVCLRFNFNPQCKKLKILYMEDLCWKIHCCWPFSVFFLITLMYTHFVSFSLFNFISCVLEFASTLLVHGTKWTACTAVRYNNLMLLFYYYFLCFYVLRDCEVCCGLQKALRWYVRITSEDKCHSQLKVSIVVYLNLPAEISAKLVWVS